MAFAERPIEPRGSALGRPSAELELDGTAMLGFLNDERQRALVFPGPRRRARS